MKTSIFPIHLNDLIKYNPLNWHENVMRTWHHRKKTKDEFFLGYLEYTYDINDIIDFQLLCICKKFKIKPESLQHKKYLIYEYNWREDKPSTKFILEIVELLI
jgi:hypothetical protein